MLLTPVFWLFDVVRDLWIVASVVLCTAAGIAAAVILPEHWWTDESVFAELELIRAEFEALRTSNADDAAWDDFRGRVGVQSESITAKLETSASSANPGRRELLWAARDSLPEMLRDSHSESSDAVEQFDAHLEQASGFLAAGTGPSDDSDWLVPAIIVADVLLVIVGACWFFLRR